MSYLAYGDDEKNELLESLKLNSIDELFLDIPRELYKKTSIELPVPLSEQYLEQEISSLLRENNNLISFLGAGCYNHYVPAIVDHLSSRSEFYSAYTPYQPEVSQGTLTAIYEFQTLICRLTGMDIANASLYDGATALAEAMLMSVRDNKQKELLISENIHPHYLDVIKTYAWANNLSLSMLPEKNGVCDLDRLDDLVNSNISAVLVQSPNFFGCIEDIEKVSKILIPSQANLILCIAEPFSMGILKKAAKLGVDIVCGEAQSFGNYPAYGGPCLGFLAAQERFMRKLPGRLVGKTIDAKGNDCFALTLQTREQHIRRDRATSNICTNQGLCALRATIFLATVGNKLKNIAEQNHQLAEYLKHELLSLGCGIVFDQPYFNEFVIRVKNANNIIHELNKSGISPGVHLGDYFKKYENCILICCTEKNSLEQINQFIKEVKRIIN